MSRSVGRIKRGPIAADVLGQDFTQVFNKAVRDTRLSRRARGLLVELLSHRDGYGVSIELLVKQGPEGRDAIRGALDELEKHGYLHRTRERDEKTGRLGNAVYEVTDMPEGLLLTVSVPWADDEPEPAAEAEGSTSEPASEKPTLDSPTQDKPLHKNTSPKNTKIQEEQDDAPSARSAADARRASTGSSARAARGGSAAPEKRAPSRNPTRLTRDEAAAIAVVERAVPPSLLELLYGQKVPHNWRLAVARELDNRTAEQLADRVARRWVAHRYQSALLAGKGIANPYAVLQALVKPGECPDAGCEDGELVDTGADCVACKERRTNRRGGLAVRSQRTGRSWWECRICRNPKRNEPEPEDRECRDCKQEAIAVCEALAARLNAPTSQEANIA
ncbi:MULTISPECIES: helix-turn-helix domain-containing protein [Streptomyces]|uniref:helix-turn-helix domain-containing protein n=1 Tax=Streptomyces TaxID=1883 RepID=UPI000B016FC0|nr:MULTISPECIES: helix-turn-helix domain-containing protein [unclassified Streptomyces]